ncbi:MAG: hypothetical protein QM751_01975 [Paludibacteraceae bacterium]
MIEIFKTNVKLKKDAKRMVALLSATLIGHKINFDLSDCDKILRVENDKKQVAVPEIKQIFLKEGFSCEVLPD